MALQVQIIPYFVMYVNTFKGKKICVQETFVFL